MLTGGKVIASLVAEQIQSFASRLGSLWVKVSAGPTLFVVKILWRKKKKKLEERKSPFN